MPLAAILDSLDGLHDEVKKEYTEKSGKFYLQVTPVGDFSLEDVGSLKKALSTERKRADDNEKAVKRYGDLDPELAREAILAKEEFDKFDPEKEAEKIAEEKWKNREQQLLARHEDALKKESEKTVTIRSALQDALITSVAQAAIAEKKGNVAVLLPHVVSKAKLIERSDGTFGHQIFDSSGNVRIGNDGGADMQIPDLVHEMSESDTFKVLFEAPGKPGTGSHSTEERSAPAGTVISFENQDTLNRSLEDVASGKVKVDMGIGAGV